MSATITAFPTHGATRPQLEQLITQAAALLDNLTDQGLGDFLERLAAWEAAQGA